MSSDTQGPLDRLASWFGRKPEHAGELAELRDRVEGRLADLVLAADGLSAAASSGIERDLVQMRERIHQSLRQAEAEPSRLNLGRVEQLESELGVLHSRILQAARAG